MLREILSETEQSIFNISVVPRTTLPPVKSSNDDPFGILTSLINKEVLFRLFLYLMLSDTN